MRGQTIIAKKVMEDIRSDNQELFEDLEASDSYQTLMKDFGVYFLCLE